MVMLLQKGLNYKKKKKKMCNNIKLRFGWWEVVCCSASGGLVIFVCARKRSLHGPLTSCERH